MINRTIKIITNCLLGVVVMVLLVTCAHHPQVMAPRGMPQEAGNLPMQPAAPTETAQARSYRSNGERIYFSSTSDRGTTITYTGDPSFEGRMEDGSSGGMMGTSNGNTSPGRTSGGYGGMMGHGNGNTGRAGGYLTCASCHGADGRGDVHRMMGMQTMVAQDIRWSALEHEFDAETFRLAVTQGQDPDGTPLEQDMPRWTIGDEDLADLITYLKTLT